MKPATPKARALLAKLQALAERGINGEKTAAQAKLAKLIKRYDFSAPDTTTADLFKGCFRPDSVAHQVLQFSPDECDIATFTKWAIESETGIRCLFRGEAIMAQATPRTAAQLATIARTIAESFTQLWTRFQSAPGVNRADRGNFILGLYEGMLHEERHNEALPPRIQPKQPKTRIKKRALNHAPGLSVHPYSVAVNLGRQIRFCVSLHDINAELDRSIQPQQITT